MGQDMLRQTGSSGLMAEGVHKKSEGRGIMSPLRRYDMVRHILVVPTALLECNALGNVYTKVV